jgi:hypothetical protein
MSTIPDAPGAAKYLLNWPTTDANIIDQSGECFLDRVRLTITANSDQISTYYMDSDAQVNYGYLFKLQQWRDTK